MKGCEKYSDLLDLLHDGELDPKRAAEVSAHAEACPNCAARLRRLAVMGDAIRASLGRIEAEGGSLPIAAAVLHEIKARRPSLAETVRDWLSDAFPVYAPYMVSAAVAAVVAIIVSFLVLRGGPEEKNFCEVKTIEFKDASTMVYKTRNENMTVIWVMEQEPAKQEGESI